MSEREKPIIPESVPERAFIAVGLAILGSYYLLKLEKNLKGSLVKDKLSSSKNIPLTQDQLATANLALYCGALDIFNKAAKKYFPQPDPNDVWPTPRGLIEASDNTSIVSALEDIYSADAGRDFSSMKRFRSQWGDEAYKLEDIYSGVNPSIVDLREEIFESVKSWNLKKRLDTGIEAAMVYTGATDDQKVRILNLAGYEESEIKKLMNSLAFSAVSSGFLGVGYEGLGIAAATAGAIMLPLGSDLFNPSVYLPVGLSYLGYYGSMIVGAEVNTRLMRNPRIKTTANITATSAYLLLDKILPPEEYFEAMHKRKDAMPKTLSNKIASLPYKTFFYSREATRDNGTRLASLLLEPIKEVGWAGTVIIPLVGPSMIASANMAGMVLNSTQAAIGLGALKVFPERKNLEPILQK